MLLDSNLIIYAAQPEHGALRRFIARQAPYVSVISKVETLGYHKLGEDEERFLKEFFDAAEVLPVSQATVSIAIQLRQKRRMSLGDVLIAGSAIGYDLKLVTHNTADFAWIDALELIDPLAQDL
jgi:predicted nucleic acid-binding protein